jgi:hypothetical protein
LIGGRSNCNGYLIAEDSYRVFGVMDFVEFTRDCWNRKTPPDEFLILIHSRFSPDSVLSVALQIVEFCGIEEFSPTPLLITYLVPLISEDPCRFFSSLDSTNPSHVIGAVYAINRCGDTLFNRLSVGCPASARCAVTALLFALTVPRRALLQSAVQRLSLSPFFSILIASARIYCPEEFGHVSALFREVDPFDGEDMRLPAVQRHLTTALLEKRLSEPHFLTPQLSALELVVSAIRLMDLGPRLRACQLHLTMRLLSKKLFRVHFASPKLMTAYGLTNICPRAFRKKEDSEPVSDARSFDRETFVDFVKILRAEESRVFWAQDHEMDSDVSWSEYPLLHEMGIERLIEMFTAPPPDDVVSLVQRARLCPASVSSIGPTLLACLQPATIDAALAIIQELMAEEMDSHQLLMAQQMAIPICERIAQFLPRITDLGHFTALWFFFLSLVHFAIRNGSQHLTNLVLNLKHDSPLLNTFLRAFISWEIEGDRQPSSKIEDLPPFEMCIEVLLTLHDTGMIPSICPLLDRFPFLWPSALIWVIVETNPQASKLLKQTPPDVSFINQLFFHASICIANKPWILCLDFPDFRMLRRFCPESPNAIHFFLARDIESFVSLGLSPKRSQHVILAWRAWLNGFGVPEFIRALLFVLIWNLELSLHPVMALLSYRCAATIVAVVCDGREDQLLEALLTAADYVENEDCGRGINGDGLAEFCVILNISIPGQATEIFRRLLEYRARLVAQAPPAGSTKLGFCVELIKSALYIPALRELIEPQVFGTPIMRQEWRSAIDYFIAESSDGYQRT